MKTILCLLALATVAHAEPPPMRVETTRDAWISSYPSEREGNNGGSPKLKLKGVQEFFLIDFDASSLQGRHVLRAQLHLHGEGPETLGRVTVSSISDEWVEGTGTSYAKVPGASSFLWARTGEKRWGDGAPDITAVVLGGQSSVWGFGDAAPRDAEGWQIIPIEPAVVQARIDGRSHGFFVFDDVGSEYTREGNTISYKHLPNRYVSSREGPRRHVPYFTLWMEAGKAAGKAVNDAEKFSVQVKVGKLPEAVTPSAGQKLPLVCFDEMGEPLDALEFFVARGEGLGFGIVAEGVKCVVPGLQIKTYSMPKIGGHYDPLIPADRDDAPLKGGEVLRAG